MTKENKKLKGIQAVITRSKEHNLELRSKLEALGAQVQELPLIKILPYSNLKEIEDVFAELGSYEWIIFTSRSGVYYFFELFFKKFKDIRCLGAVHIACIGKGTAEEVGKYHLEVDYIPEQSLSESLAKGLMDYQNLENAKVLVITGNLNKDTLVKMLETEGQAIVDTLQVYETHLEDISNSNEAKEFQKNGADVIVFVSASAVNSFAKQAKFLQLETNAKKPSTCSMGPETSKAMKESGIPVDIEASEHSLDGVTQALVKRLGS